MQLDHCLTHFQPTHIVMINKHTLQYIFTIMNIQDALLYYVQYGRKIMQNKQTVCGLGH